MLVFLNTRLAPPPMIDITETETFACNLASLPDAHVRYGIQAQLNRMRCGVWQYCQSVVDNISALHVGGLQIYYAMIGENQVLLLCLGESACADEDVTCAVKLAEEATR